MQNDKGTILIVEDNKKLLEANRELLQDDGNCEVYAAHTLEEARNILRDGVTPDVAVLDIKLPDGSGLDFAAELRKSCRPSIIFLTAKTAKKDVLAGLAEGAVQYMTKPYDATVFQMTVMNVLNDIMTSRRPKLSSLLNEGELAVARLVADGVSNKNIAAALFVSEKCVKVRLTRLYKKCGIAGENDERRKKLAEMLGPVTSNA